MKLPAIFRRMTTDEARRRLAKHANAAQRQHQRESMRLRFEASVALSQADAHDGLAETYARLAKEYGP